MSLEHYREHCHSYHLMVAKCCRLVVGQDSLYVVYCQSDRRGLTHPRSPRPREGVRATA